ncbi:MAG: transcriptional repressor [Patescibacteria group bacterium]
MQNIKKSLKKSFIKKKIEKILLERNLRKTESRLRILQLFFRECNEFSADEIFAKLSKIDLATIYRNLEIFVDENILEVKISGITKIYSLSSSISNHHHAKCEKCKKLFPISCSNLELSDIPKNFLVFRHSVEIFGVCEKCNKI